jgi:hypothetical protein
VGSAASFYAPFDTARAGVSEFNPFSLDAQLGAVLERLKSQDRMSSEMHAENKLALGAILAEAKITNGRITKLEGRWKYIAGSAAGVSLCATLLWEFIKKFVAP